MLAVCSFCGSFIVFICPSLWCYGLDVDLVVLVSELFYLLYNYFLLLEHLWDSRYLFRTIKISSSHLGLIIAQIREVI